MASPVRTRVARALGRRGLIVALATAAGVFGLLLVQGVLQTALTSAQIAGSLQSDLGAYLASVWVSELQGSLLTSLPFAIGVFLALWQIAPIGPELRFAHVVTRALLAAGVGTLVVVAVVVIAAVIGGLTGLPAEFGHLFFGNSFPSDRGAFAGFGGEVASGVLRAVGTFVDEAPTVVLASLLLWGWLQRHPSPHEVSGAVDEV